MLNGFFIIPEPKKLSILKENVLLKEKIKDLENMLSGTKPGKSCEGKLLYATNILV